MAFSLQQVAGVWRLRCATTLLQRVLKQSCLCSTSNH